MAGIPQGGIFCFSVTWETVLNNVMEQVFSLSYIALYGLNQQTLQLGQHRTYLEIRKHEQKGQKKTAKIDFWFRKNFVLFLLRVLPTELSNISANLDHFKDVKP